MSLTALIIISVIAAVVVAALILLELFFVPGFGLPGIFGVLGLFGMSGYLFFNGEGTLAMAFIILCGIFFGVGFALLSKRDLKGFALQKSVNEVVRALPHDLKRGDRGVTRSRLTLGGEAEIRGRLFDVESEEGFIMEDTPIYISRIENNKVYVRVVKDELLYGPHPVTSTSQNLETPSPIK